MTAEKNKALVQLFVEEVWNKGNLNFADEILSSQYVGHDPADPRETRGIEDFKLRAGMYRQAFPDLRIEVHDMFGTTDQVVTRYTAKGTHKGDLLGVSPTNKSVKTTGILISRIEGGKIKEEFVNWDCLGLLQQLGAVQPELTAR